MQLLHQVEVSDADGADVGIPPVLDVRAGVRIDHHLEAMGRDRLSASPAELGGLTVEGVGELGDESHLPGGIQCGIVEQWHGFSFQTVTNR